MISEITVESLMSLMDAGNGRSDLDRGQLLLAWGYREESWKTLSSLPLGARARRLLELRRAFFGDQLTLSARCPNCGAPFEFATNIGEILAADLQEKEPTSQIAVGTAILEVRPLNAHDLTLLPSSITAEAARKSLASRCLVTVFDEDGREINMPEMQSLQSDWVDAVDNLLQEQDPLSALIYCLDCLDCHKAWRAQFDITDLLWQELEVENAIVIEEIHLLAAHYGWREADIVAIPPVRRRSYAQHLRERTQNG
ncbi:MAG: hypothetical protein MI743_08710 [Sneathiellales bacterium]|nr:hypothetical protein [Sneathiellales bacterium]